MTQLFEALGPHSIWKNTPPPKKKRMEKELLYLLFPVVRPENGQWPVVKVLGATLHFGAIL